MDFENEKKPSFIRKIDWCAFWIATGFSFAIYLYTLAPTVTLEDSGELAVAGDWLGVPHPPGYPIWTILAWSFSKIFSFVTYLGQPNPAWSIALLSAVFGALAAGISAMLISRSGSHLLNQSWSETHQADQTTENIICCIGGVVSSLLFAFSPVMWSQANIVEVYSLNAFFLVLIFLLSYVWMCEPSDKLLYITAFVFGLGLTNYQVLLLAALPLVFIIMLKNPKLFRDLAIVGAPFIGFILMKGGINGFLESLNDSAGNLDRGIASTYVAADLFILALAYFLLPHGKVVAITFLFAQLGVAFYVYMPIVSDLRNPPMNWGYPRTWQGFKHAITRGQYEKLNPTEVFSAHFIRQMGSYLLDLTKQFYLPVALLGFLPFTVWRVNVGKKRFNALYFAIACALVSTLLLVIEPFGVRWDKVSVIGIFAVMGIGFMTILVNVTMEFWSKIFDKESTWTDIIVSVFILLVGVAIYAYCVHGLFGAIKSLTEPLRSAKVNLSGEQVTSIFLKTIGLAALMIIPLATKTVIIRLRKTRYSPEMSIDLTSQKWIIAILIGFLTMSLLLIVLANPKGDIQDNFIQKVKFISSHALYAMWIGYGLIFFLGMIITLTRKRKDLQCLALGLACLLPLAPLYKNYFDPVILKEYGGAEQNGHDFGWQFGNYQLRGAAAITEELSPEEEPLPNPQFPPAMTQDAIFFGGTDPGRFVPTYMIYSARVRSDVFLITQNALADNTYLNVMRDLYGDDIWIPSQSDSAQSFKIYVDEVNAGKRPRNAELKVEGGRVQVSGALGVMEINGILCSMIFDHNNWKHDFYVEESYVIGWMFPYLSPHGLIMKINQNPTPITPEMVNNDMDFWDWYTRRLTDNNRFTRDIVAMKSFDKLRAAISGLYASRGMLKEAERAYQEARILYPLSPEANFRLAQEVLGRQGRFDEIENMLELLGKEDPGNTKVPEYLKNIKNMKNMTNRMIELEKLVPKLNIDNALELCRLYQQSGNIPKLRNMTQNITNNTNLPPQHMFALATILHAAHQYDEMNKCLAFCLEKIAPNTAPPQTYLQMAQMFAASQNHNGMREALAKYLTLTPADWRGWLDMAKIELLLNNTAGASKAVNNAIQYGGNEAIQIINSDPNLAPLRRNNAPINIPQNLLGIPSSQPNRNIDQLPSNLTPR